MPFQSGLFEEPEEDFGHEPWPGLSIAFGVFGSSIRFKMANERWSGQSEYVKCLQHLCHLDSIGKVYLISQSDYARAPRPQQRVIDPHHKIIDCPARYPIEKFVPRQWASDDEEADAKFAHIKQLTTKILDDAQELTLDFGLFFWSQGINAPSGIPGFLRTILPPHTRAKTLDMTMHYASPMIDFVNRTGVPWFLLATDPRYIKYKMRPRDFVNTPREIMGQFNEELNWERPFKYERSAGPIGEPEKLLMHNPIQHTYCGIEKMNLIGEKMMPFDTPKDLRFTIVSAQVDGPALPAHQDFRFQQIKRWILEKDHDGSAVIYGRWKPNRTDGWPQFKGFIETTTLDNIMRRTKYSLVLPTKKGWATSKPWELLQLSVIPFFQSDYDVQYNMTPRDHMLRCATPEEFYEKMDYFDVHEDKRLAFVKQCQEEFLADAFSGEFMTRAINNQLKKHNFTFQV